MATFLPGAVWNVLHSRAHWNVSHFCKSIETGLNDKPKREIYYKPHYVLWTVDSPTHGTHPQHQHPPVSPNIYRILGIMAASLRLKILQFKALALQCSNSSLFKYVRDGGDPAAAYVYAVSSLAGVIGSTLAPLFRRIKERENSEGNARDLRARHNYVTYGWGSWWRSRLVKYLSSLYGENSPVS